MSRGNYEGDACAEEKVDVGGVGGLFDDGLIGNCSE